jgi:hypothetical protein
MGSTGVVGTKWSSAIVMTTGTVITGMIMVVTREAITGVTAEAMAIMVITAAGTDMIRIRIKQV